MSEFSIIGKSIPRLDGPAKVTGESEYVGDLNFPGLWVGGTVRSGVPHGKLKSIRQDPSFDWSSVVFVTAKDIQGTPFVHIVRDDYPALASETITYATQAVALIAAPDEKTLKAALAAVTLEIEPLPAVLTVKEALEGKEIVWGTDNILDEYHVNQGDIEQGFADADIIVEGQYETGLQEQIYLETQGMIARPMPDGSMEIIGSIQCPFYVLGGVAGVLNLPCEKVRVKLAEVGGAFGGKEDYPTILAVHAGLLAQKSGHPVRIIYDRSEDILVTPKRHPATVYHKTGVKKDGTITAMEIDLVLDGGAYTTLSRVILQRSVLHTTCGYKIPNAKIRGRAVATHTPPTGAFRGFGAPQAIFAVERQMDKIAGILGINPLDLRLKNLMHPGDAFPYKQVMQEGLSAEDVLARVAEISDYRKKHAAFSASAPKGHIRKGIGISLALHGGGFTGSGEDKMNTTVKIIFENGIFTLLTSAVDMGQGSSTVLPMIAAERLGVSMDYILHPAADTWVAPNSGPTVASRATMFVGKVVDQACIKLIDKLKKFIAEWKGCPEKEVTFKKGFFHVNGEEISIQKTAEQFHQTHGELSIQCVYETNATSVWDEEKFEGTAYKGYGWIAQVVEVEVDTDTYEVNPIECFIVAEVGRAINPTLATGQLEGGLLQGFGWAHIEDIGITPEGHYNAAHMNAYLVPTTLDTPKWHVELLEVPCDAGPFGAKGIGELPANGGAPAFLAAIENATGVFGTQIPLTGERLFTLIHNQKQGGDSR